MTRYRYTVSFRRFLHPGKPAELLEEFTFDDEDWLIPEAAEVQAELWIDTNRLATWFLIESIKVERVTIDTVTTYQYKANDELIQGRGQGHSEG